MARVFAATAVAAVVTGWGVGQYPWMLVDQLTINDAAGAHTALLVVIALAAVIVLPPLSYLLWLTQTEKWSRT
jgi:cytochrome bd ubiquinol oxidase subunit II